MSYLYGDSSPTTLRHNFLEFLRDALDFCVYVLQADARIQEGRAHMEELRRQADLEMGQLEAFGDAVTATIEKTPKGAADSPTVACAERLTTMTADAVRSSVQGVRDRLAADIRQAEAEESVERDGCHKALESLLKPHFPPDEACVVTVASKDGGGYEAAVEGTSESMQLGWRFELGIPDGHLFASALTMERLMPRFTLQAPELTGWIRKEVKTRPQRLDRFVMSEVIDDGSSVALKLRADGGVGFDVKVFLSVRGVAISRVTPNDDAASGKFEPHEEDIPKLVEIGKMIHAAVDSLVRKRLLEASYASDEFRGLERFVGLVEGMVAALAPTTKEISRRSLEPTELVLRRLLADDRREEIFVAKSTLLEKLSPLDHEGKALFDPLGLDPAMASLSALPPAPRDAGTKRAELPPSQPPRRPPPPDTRSSGPPPPPPAVPHISVPPDSDGGPNVDAAELDADELIALASDPPEVPDGDSQRDGGLPDSPGLRDTSSRNPELVAKLKRIMSLAKQGKTDDAYREYGALFSSRLFADNPLDDRRQLLKMLLFAKAPAQPTAAFKDAHRSALDRLKVLVERLGDPVDYEMLGICHLVLGDPPAAGVAFKKALEIERLRNPQSELCGNLMRRVSAL